LTIARHFNAGFNPQMIQVPKGRPTFADRNHMGDGGNDVPSFSRPGGTLAGAGENPALKRRAIVALSLRDEAARRRKRLPGRARSPAMSQPGGQWQFGVDERGKGRFNLK
jgi:hypothetical protein